MKRALCLALAAVLLTALPTLAKVTLPDVQEFKLDNRLTVRVAERHDLPLFSMQLVFHAGSSHDPAGRDGLAAISNEMLMRGTPDRTAQQIAEEVAFVGGTFSNFCARASAGFSGEFLTAKGETGFIILGDILSNSLLAPEEFDKVKTRQLASIQNSLEDPSTVASNKFYETVWQGSRFAHPTEGSTESVESLTRDDMVAYLKDYYTPDNAVLVVCGDITPSQIRDWATQHLGSWQGTSEVAVSDKEFPPTRGKKVVLYDKPDATQTQIRIGATAFPLGHPDMWPYEVARTIYGGSFTSRLMNEIRVNRGLSYGVRCYSTQYPAGGLVYVSTFTKNATVGEVLDIILNESARMQTEPIPDSEYVGAINYRCGLYPLNYETSDDIVGTLSNMWLYDLDKSYYENYQENLRATRPADAMDIARKYFPGDDFVLVLVGNAEEVKPQVEKYGELTVIPLSSQ